MSASTKLSTAVKALCFLSKVYPEPKSSSEIANFTGVNASKLRKILSLLVKSDIVQSISGSTGGFCLKKIPTGYIFKKFIVLSKIEKLFIWMFMKNHKTENDITKLNDFFLDLFADIQVDIENKMSKIKLKNIIEQLSIK